MPAVDAQRLAAATAVTACDDLAARARELRHLHEAWETTARVPTGVRSVVARAWTRQDGGPHPPVSPIDVAALEERRRSAPTLARVSELLRPTLLDFAQEAANELVTCDADGYVLWVDGPSSVLRRTEALGFVPGACWTESAVGSNALGTALAERTCLQMFGPEHSNANQHAWVCTGAPVVDPVTGDLAGAVTLSGPLASAHPHTLALVRSAVATAVDELRREHRWRLGRLAQVTAAHGAYVLVDADGWVAAASGVRADGRLWAPGGWREGEVWLPTHGTFACDPVPGGWLLHPVAGTGPTVRLHRDPRPRLEIVRDGQVQEVPLTSRQHALVRALAENPAGLDSAELRRAAYGPSDEVSPTTVRAEVSRLRRRLGPLLESRPYRLVAERVVT